MAVARNAFRVVHVTSVHKPFDVRIFHKQCVTLARAGYDITLVQSGDKIETVNGVKIVPFGPALRRILRMTTGVWRAYRVVASLKPAIVHFHDIEFIWAGLLLKLAGHRVIYDVHEDVAKDLQDKAYLPRWAIWPIGLCVWAFERMALAFFDRLVPATEAIHRRFPADRATLVRNTPIIGELSTVDAPPFASRPMNAVYLGGLAEFNGPRAMVAAFEEPGLMGDAQLLLGGRFVDEQLEAEMRARPGWARVQFHGWIDRSAISAMLIQARVGLVLYQPSPNVVESEPNKFFEMMSAGLPLVASNFPVWRQLIERFQCGIAVDPNDPKQIAEAIAYLLTRPEEAEAMGKRGQDAVMSEYNWTIDGERLVKLYDSLLSKAPIVTTPATAGS